MRTLPTSRLPGFVAFAANSAHAKISPRGADAASISNAFSGPRYPGGSVDATSRLSRAFTPLKVAFTLTAPGGPTAGRVIGKTGAH